MTPIGLCYVASPYTKCADLDRAFQQAARIAAHLSKSGMTVFSPIAHGHSLMRCAGLDHKDPGVFAGLNRKMCEIADVLIVILMEGWHESDGVREEIAYFEAQHKPIFDCDPLTLVMKRRQSPSGLRFQDMTPYERTIDSDWGR